MDRDIFSSSFVEKVGCVSVLDEYGLDEVPLESQVHSQVQSQSLSPPPAGILLEITSAMLETEEPPNEKVSDVASTIVSVSASPETEEESVPCRMKFLPPIAAKNGQAKVGLKALPDQREHMARVKDSRLNIMVAGRMGSGKTTFLNTLFRCEWKVESDSSETSIVSVNKFQISEENVNLQVTCIDTPGFGNSLDNRYCWMPLVKFIDNQFESYLHQTEQPDRALAKDSRVHCCIYFITGNGDRTPSPLDLEAMKELSKRVNLIPVISKADQYSEPELLRLKGIINRCMAQNQIPICDFVDDLALKKHILDTAPYAIVGANTATEGCQVLGRRYPWGCIDVENRSHCDFALLRDVLIRQNMLDLIVSTETNYGHFRQAYLTDRFNQAVALHTEFLQKHADNGLVQFVMYNQIRPSPVGDNIEDSELFKAQLHELQKKFGASIQVQEHRFKNWKRELTEQQAVMNTELENYHFRVMKLQQQIKRIEEITRLQEHPIPTDPEPLTSAESQVSSSQLTISSH